MVVDCCLEQARSQWLKRAETFEAARPNPAEGYCGGATIEQLREQWARLTEVAVACRARAEVSPLDIETEVEMVLREVS